jgi:hypothetical protein
MTEPLTDAEIQQICDGLSVCTSCYKKIKCMDGWAAQEFPTDKLLTLCRRFIKDNQISCAESIWQTDRVSENALSLIEDIAELLGYHVCETD